MAIGNKWVYSKVAANNGNALIDNGVDARETLMTVPQVNDSIRALLAVERAFLDTLGATITTTGSGSAYIYASPTGFPFQSYFVGQYLTFIPNFTNAGAATINIDTLGPKNIFYWDGNGYVATTGGEIKSGQFTAIQYDGTQFRLLTFDRREPDSPLTIGALTATTGNFSGLLSGVSISLTTGIDVGFSSTPVADTVRVGDANFRLDFVGGEAGTAPALVFDINDLIYYDRVNNDFNVTIGGTDILRVSSTLTQLGNAVLSRSVNNGAITLTSGIGDASGANIIMNGPTHPTAAYDFALRVDTTAWLFRDHSLARVDILSTSVVIGAPTGGGLGADTINAQAVFDDSVLLTDLVLDLAVLGRFSKKRYKKNPIAKEIAKWWFDPDAYADYWYEHRTLPGMVSWEDQAKRPAVGEIVTRLTAVVETQAVLIEQLNSRLKRLEDE